MDKHDHIIDIPELLSNEVSKRLVFKTEGLIIDNKFTSAEFIAAADMAAFRLGARRFKGFYFEIARQFVIEIKLHNDTKKKIKITSLYSLRNQRYEDIWADVVASLYQNYFSSHLQFYMELYHMGQPFSSSGINFYNDGIVWNNRPKLMYRHLALSNYQTHFVIHNAKSPGQHVTINFIDNWNAYLTRLLLNYIVEEHQEILR